MLENAGPVVDSNDVVSAIKDKSSLERTLYLFGQPVAHSASPSFHNTIFRELGIPWRYIRLDSKDTEDLAWLMRRDDFIGAAVTMPNKVQSMDLVDVLTIEAQRIGCINTIYSRPNLVGGEERRLLVGTNTDWIGIQRALLKANPNLRSYLEESPALVIGGGATCRSAIFALTEGLGAKLIYLVNRDPEEAMSTIKALKQNGLRQEVRYVETLEYLQSISKFPVVAVSAVPDLAPKTESERTARSICSAMLQTKSDCNIRKVFLEMCYDPTPWTWLANLAKEHEWDIVDGLDVMEHQAIEQAVLWTERPLKELPSQAANEAIRRACHR
ncbi:hypothetical protein F1880_004821 [Penicillium rolfsii]|nr:hypothetical protein F1880_004821 [Penicillium rolfsii]